jgi:murein endopeptidase
MRQGPGQAGRWRCAAGAAVVSLLLLPAASSADEPAVPADPEEAALALPAPSEADVPEAAPGADPVALPEPVLEPEPAAEPVLEVLPEAAGPMDAETLLRLAEQDVASLGPLSIGTPDAGLLVNPVRMPDGPLWKVRDPFEAYGTRETIDFIVRAVEAVETRHPGSPRVVVGDLSRPDGGRLNRHRSHQAGRDVDIGFYYARGEVDGFLLARQRDLDLPRTWALVRAFLIETDVDRIFVDRSLIGPLYVHARDEAGEDRGWLDDVFGRGARKGIIQHERRHRDHLHVRFFNRVAQESGRVVYPVLVAQGVLPPPVVKHRIRRGETLGHIARRYGTSASAIRAANGMRGSQLRAGRSLLVPIRKVPADVSVVVPERRLPPPPATQATLEPAPESAPESDVAAPARGGSRD